MAKKKQVRERSRDTGGSIADQLKALGMVDESQEKEYQSEMKAREKSRQEEQRRHNQSLSTRNNSFGRGGGKGNFGGRDSYDGKGYVATPSIVGKIYGKEVEIEASTKPAELATAPYNFIPLPRAVLPSELEMKLGGLLAEEGGWKRELKKEEKERLSSLFHEFRHEGERYSGRIELDIKTLTPLFIGGNGEETFAPAGVPMIPGSTLRGMVKNLYQILTCGAWEKGESLTGQHLYYRCLMASNREPQNKVLNELYKERMTSTAEGKVKKNAKPGFLVKVGTKYRIYPIIEDKQHSIVIKEYMEKFRADISKSLVRWDGNIAYVQTGIISQRERDKIKSKEEIEEFMRVTPPARRKEIGKQYYRYLDIREINKAKFYEVSDEVIEEYNNDKNRRGVNLIQEKDNEKILGRGPSSIPGLEDFKYIVPCHYLLENGQVSSFGHGQSFRVAYRQSIMEAIPQALQKPIVDFASAVFGRSLGAASWAGRVAFDDAVLVSGKRTGEKAKARALMNPNPTALQMYLEQTDEKKLVHWDSPGAKIRGYKLYWHNPKASWKAAQKEIELIEGKRGENKGEVLKTIHPLLKDSEFKGAIRFRDLTAAELGALLKVFHVAEGKAAYKLGMGKSIGLGSVEIGTRLLLEKDSRYEKFLEGGRLHDSLAEEREVGRFIGAFEKHVASQGRCEDYKRMLESLSLMLDYSNTGLPYWDSAVAPINGATNDKENKDTRFKMRAVLPEAKTVAAWAAAPIK